MSYRFLAITILAAAAACLAVKVSTPHIALDKLVVTMCMLVGLLVGGGVEGMIWAWGKFKGKPGISG
jgi:hypothetical protein